MNRRHFSRRLTNRRHFPRRPGGNTLVMGLVPVPELFRRLQDPLPGEGLVAYVHRTAGGWDPLLYSRLVGAANEFKEGDDSLGLAADGQDHRRLARKLLGNTTLREVGAHPILDDAMHRTLCAALDGGAREATADWTLEALRTFLVERPEEEIRPLMPGLSSDAIGCVVKLLSNAELERVSAKLCNALLGTNIGAKGHLGARVQPNSPTDHPDDIRWQVFNAWAYGVGDVLLGTNPVSSEPEQVHRVEETLREVLRAFGLEGSLPHCVLAHIDVQAEVEQRWPGSTALWFQSIAGSDAANATFGVSVARLEAHADARTGPYGLYLETGQGADFTNGHGQRMDMVLHESRKYGLARHLSQRVAAASGRLPWVHVNDVAGFIGPEVFRTRDQLIRCCLEDLVMGKLHGLCVGLDVCSTLHMDVSLDDLDHCLNVLAPAQPAYLMALPTKIDPMLGYLTTGFQDHVRLRQRHGLRVDERMGRFFAELAVLDEHGAPGPNYGDTLGVYVQYCLRKGDARPAEALRAEGAQQMRAVRARGVFLTSGHGTQPWDLDPEIAREVRGIYDDAKLSIWAEFDEAFPAALPDALVLHTRAKDRADYILHPTTGEALAEASTLAVQRLREAQREQFDVQVVLSDGLNALAMNDRTQLAPFLEALEHELRLAGRRAAPRPIVLHRGRVRAGYRIGEQLFGGLCGRRAILHVVGERPGTGHRTFSVYITAADGSAWGQLGKVDHDITRVVAGIANTALLPDAAARTAVALLDTLWAADAK
jgi:ethanolamine ammonia-lyase large subunit